MPKGLSAARARRVLILKKLIKSVESVFEHTSQYFHTVVSQLCPCNRRLNVGRKNRLDTNYVYSLVHCSVCVFLSDIELTL